MGRSKGPDKNRDAEGMLTREGVAANKAAKQLQKATTAATNSLGGVNRTGLQAGDAYAGLSANLNAADNSFNQQLGQNYLNSYNTLKDQKKKSREQLSQLGNMNRQMGYNPTTGMGIGESANFNTIGAGRDLQGIANLLGKLPTPMNIARQILGGLTNVGSNLKTDFTNTANALSQFQQAPNLSTGFSGLYNNFLDSLNTEEETYDGPFPVQKPIQPDAFMQAYNEDMSGVSPYGATDGTFREKILDPVMDYISSFKSDATLGDLKDSYSIYGGDYNALNFEPGVSQSSTTPEINISPGFRPDVLTYGNGLPVTYGTSDDDIMQGGYVGYSGTGPYSVDFDTMGQPFNRQEAGRRANRGPGDGPRIPLPGDPDYVIPLPDASKGTGGSDTSPPPNFGLFIDPAANYNMLYGGFNQGGRVPPMSGPMSNGLGNLFKMK